MKRLVAIIFVLGCAACASKKEEPAASEPRTSPVAAAPLHLAKPDEARVGLDLAAARSQIRTMREERGAYPERLSDLGVRLHFPDDLIYDPATGAVRSKSYPRL